MPAAGAGWHAIRNVSIAEFETGWFCLKPGETLVLYSDGITESATASGEEFGESRLEEVVKAHCGRPLAEIQAQVLPAVRRWSGAGQRMI